MIGKWILVFGLMLILVGVAVWLLESVGLPLGRLPGGRSCPREELVLFLPHRDQYCGQHRADRAAERRLLARATLARWRIAPGGLASVQKRHRCHRPGAVLGVHLHPVPAVEPHGGVVWVSDFATHIDYRITSHRAPTPFGGLRVFLQQIAVLPRPSVRWGTGRRHRPSSHRPDTILRTCAACHGPGESARAAGSVSRSRPAHSGPG